MKYLKKYFACITSVVFFLSYLSVSAQNVAITDNESYTAHPSAMLDVKSVTKGMLVPRLTTVQREAVSSPATGLLVFDTDEGAFYFYNGTAWVDLSAPGGEIWVLDGSDVYLAAFHACPGRLAHVVWDAVHRAGLAGRGEIRFPPRRDGLAVVLAIGSAGRLPGVDSGAIVEALWDSGTTNRGGGGGD